AMIAQARAVDAEKEKKRKHELEYEASHGRDLWIVFADGDKGWVRGTVVQIIDGSNMLMDVEEFDEHKLAWIANVYTEPYTDGDRVSAYVVVDGTKRYMSAFGVRTVKLLRSIPSPSATQPTTRP